MRTSASILFVAALLILAALLTFGPNSAKVDNTAGMPDIIFLADQGGFGHLAYDAARNQYVLQGPIHSYVEDDGNIRLMGKDEGGGRSADPGTIAVTAQGIYGSTPYGRILRYNSTGDILDSSSPAPLHYYQGSERRETFATDKGLFQMGYSDKDDSTLFAYSSELQKIGELSLKQHNIDFLQVGDKLYSLTSKHATECEFDCDISFGSVQQVVVDIANPTQPRIIDEKTIALQRDFVGSAEAVSPELRGWLLRTWQLHNPEKLEWRTMEQPDKVAGQLMLPQGMRTVALTKTSPFALIESTEGSLFLHSVFIQNNTPTLSNGVALPLHSYDHVTIQQENGKLFITGSGKLLVFDRSGQLVLEQNFNVSSGLRSDTTFSFKRITFAHGLER